MHQRIVLIIIVSKLVKVLPMLLHCLESAKFCIQHCLFNLFDSAGHFFDMILELFRLDWFLAVWTLRNVLHTIGVVEVVILAAHFL